MILSAPHVMDGSRNQKALSLAYKLLPRLRMQVLTRPLLSFYTKYDLFSDHLERLASLYGFDKTYMEVQLGNINRPFKEVGTYLVLVPPSTSKDGQTNESSASTDSESSDSNSDEVFDDLPSEGDLDDDPDSPGDSVKSSTTHKSDPLNDSDD